MKLVPIWLAAVALCLRSVDASADVQAAATAIAREIERGDHPGFEAFVFKGVDRIDVRYVDPKLEKRLPDLRSATKSVTALLIGIAIDRKEIPSVQSKIVDLLPDYRQLLAKDERKLAITIEDLLTMRSGLECNDWDPRSPGHEDKMYRRRDWLEFWASQKMMAAPGESFSYCTGNVIALGEVLRTGTGMRADEYAAKYLFAPLGIHNVRWETWDRGRKVDTGGHLRLHPDDLLKIGEMVLARGTHAGTSIVSPGFIDAMATAHVALPRQPQSYGYLWWIHRTKQANLPRTDLWWAQGNGGSLLVIMPQLKAILLTTGTRFNQPNALEPMFWLRDRLMPHLKESVQ